MLTETKVHLTISIALCTYNGARFLQEQLDSIATQTRLPDEVVVCDDGSTDNTVEILESWAKNVPFDVRIVRNEVNLGFNKNFAKALSLCTQDVLFISDQDDVWLPEKIEKMTSVLENDLNIGIIYCDAELVDSSLNSFHVGFNEIERFRILCDYLKFFGPYSKHPCSIAGSCCALRKQIFSIMCPFPSHDKLLSYDGWIYALGYVLTRKHYIDEYLLLHRYHANNASSSGDVCKAIQTDIEYLKREYRDRPGNYYFRYDTIQYFRERVRQLPTTKKQRFCLRYLRHQDIHLKNRERVQRNAIIFGILGIYEFCLGRYFLFLHPWKSFFYDLKTGILNALKLRKNQE